MPGLFPLCQLVPSQRGAIQNPRDVTPTAGVLLGSGERMEGYVRRGIFYLEKSGCVPARVDVVQRWRHLPRQEFF
eukprot:scaffold152948_cov24-Attheya_sp.AAC.1